MRTRTYSLCVEKDGWAIITSVAISSNFLFYSVWNVNGCLSCYITKVNPIGHHLAGRAYSVWSPVHSDNPERLPCLRGIEIIDVLLPTCYNENACTVTPDLLLV